MSTPSSPSAPQSPSLPWRFQSSLTMGIVGSLCRGFLYGLNNTEVFGLDRFLETLDKRRDVEGRNRGLITVSNHVSIMDDPIMWGVLPLRYAFNPSNHRWGLASYDICFQNKFASLFFTFGQTLPTHRSAHSPHGGLFQPTLTQAIRLLSCQPFSSPPTGTTSSTSHKPSPSLQSPDLIDPFESGTLTYSTNSIDVFPAPSAYLNRRFSWVHIFPEGRVHQRPQKYLRYFKWGVSRLILESEPLPEIIPIFVDGHQNVYPENRQYLRPLPRPGNKIKIAFGEPVDGEKVFGDLREKWQRLGQMQKEALVKQGKNDWEMEMGELTEGLKYGKEAVKLRIEVTDRIRKEVLKVRRSLGYADEDAKNGKLETWIEEGPKRKGRMEDGSWVGETSRERGGLFTCKRAVLS